MPAWPDWLWWSLGGVLAALGLVLLGWSLLADRSRGRRRCPRCWYDMSATPGRICSECGYEAKRERKLFRTRRRWRWASVAIVPIALGIAAAATPTVTAKGWHTFIPTTVLITALPLLKDGADRPGWRHDAVHELFENRLGIYVVDSSADLWDWQWRLLLRHVLTHIEQVREAQQWQQSDYLYQNVIGDAIETGAVHRLGLVDRVKAHAQPSVHVNFPNAWPIDAPVRYSASVDCSYFFPAIRVTARRHDTAASCACSPAWQPYTLTCANGEPDYRGQVQLPPERGLTKIELTFHLDVERQGSTDERPITLPWHSETQIVETYLVGTVDAEIEPVLDPVLDREVRESFRWRLIEWDGVLHLVATLSPDCKRREQEIGDVARIEILHKGQVVFSKSRSFDLGFTAGHEACPELRIDLESFLNEHDPQMSRPDESWTLRFRIDPIEIYTWSQGKSYWPGVIEQPIDWPAALAAREKWD